MRIVFVWVICGLVTVLGQELVPLVWQPLLATAWYDGNSGALTRLAAGETLSLSLAAGALLLTLNGPLASGPT